MRCKCKINGETLTLMFVYIGQIFFFSFTTLIWFPQSLMLQLTNVVTYKLKSYVTTNKTVDYLSWYLQQFLLSNAPPVGQWHPEGKKVKEEQKFSFFFSLANKAP